MPIIQSTIAYNYTGQCPRSGQILRLPRTPEAKQIARELMATLAIAEGDHPEGKMYGVLLTVNANGQRQVLKAFSGLVNQQAVVEGWVPPIPGRECVALAEAQTLAQLNQIRDQLLALQAQNQDICQIYQPRSQQYVEEWQILTQTHAERKQARQIQRQSFLEQFKGDELAKALTTLEDESRKDGLERRYFKRDRDQILVPLQDQQTRIQTQIQTLKLQRKLLSRQLQAQMHQSYWLSNFAGESAPLQQIFGGEMPTGTGDCCAPKLLHYAATHGLTPLAMAEFWWGEASANGDKIPGEFYGACRDRCQPIMGFLLSGLSALADTPTSPLIELPILYEDEWLVAVDKPVGLLSVPGRYRDRQASVLLHLQQQLDLHPLWAVHRLDQDTSGVLLLAKDFEIYRHLSQQFQHRQVEKFYEAILAGRLEVESGVIDLPLWGDPCDRPRQSVNWEQGKSSQTRFWLLSNLSDLAQVRFQPLTGRTHQLRVHAADPRGLGVPILGDRLYGSPSEIDRLYLHAQELSVRHPQFLDALTIKSSTSLLSE